MTKFLNKFYDVIDKIGKPNFILIVFILIVIVITGLYATFSLFTTSEGLTLVDGINTYKFILNASNQENSVTISANSSKNFTITLSNTDAISLLYGIYYSSSDNLDNVSIGYTGASEHQGSGLIAAKTDYVVDCKIYNNSNNDVTIHLGVKYGFENGGELTLETGKNWLVKGAVALSVTDGVSTYYNSLNDAVAAASTTATTTITLLEDIKEDVINEDVALYDTVIDLNNQTIDGFIHNLDTDATMTLKNGTVENNTAAKTTVNNYGTMTIENGTYLNNATSGHCIWNHGTMTIEDGVFTLTYVGTGSTTIYSDTSSTLTINGGTVDTNSWGVVNNGATVKINAMTIKVNVTGRNALLNREGGTTTLKDSILESGDSVVLWNADGTVVIYYVSGIHGKISGVVYGFGWNSDGSAEWQVYGKSDGACATWTDNNGQDDLKWVTMNSYTGPYNTYLYCRVYKSDHNNESGTYITHIYNSAKTTFYYGSGWTMP